MDCAKTGSLIRKLRTEAKLTQRQLAEAVGVTDKAVSKWETGRGAPDITVVGALARALGVGAECLLTGKMETEPSRGGNMKKTKYYHCPSCGQIAAATGNAEVFCCGRRLEALTAQKADGEHVLNMEPVEDEWFLTTGHPMAREHYITFIAFATGDRIALIRQYPEWDLQQRIPRRHGLLLWHCSEHGLFYRNI